jgi:hypothetical protein
MNRNEIREKFRFNKKLIIIPKNINLEKSDIDLSKFNNKMYGNDHYYANTIEPDIKIKGAYLSGMWEISNYSLDSGEFIIKLTEDKSGNYIELEFNNSVEGIKFMNELSVGKKIKQKEPGFNFEKIINSEKTKNGAIFGGLISLALFSYLKFKKNKI